MYKNFSLITVSILVSLLAKWLNSSFIESFADNQITLLTTLLAINIASSSLIAGKLRDINQKTGYKFVDTRTELKRSLIVQVTLIAIAFFLMIFTKSEKVIRLMEPDWLNFISNTITVGIFVYYLDAILDLGKALFSLLDFDADKSTEN